MKVMLFWSFGFPKTNICYEKFLNLNFYLGTQLKKIKGPKMDSLFTFTSLHFHFHNQRRGGRFATSSSLG